VQTPEGTQLGTVVILRDVTREAETENLKDAFITSISHELRTPLTVIKVYTDLMLKTANGHLDDRQLKFMNNIDKGSDQLERHINQLINISEIQAGTINLEKEHVDFLELVQKVADRWRERFESKGLKLKLHLPQKRLWVFVDPNHLSWAVENVLSNAYNYTQEGQVDVRVFEQDGEVGVDVTDTGIGIAAADLPHLFDRFFRAENVENFDVRGVGLGLFLTRSIVEMHEGRVSVRSELGVGTTLSVALPLSEQIREDKLASH
jgi:signal transduction histidine kinase